VLAAFHSALYLSVEGTPSVLPVIGRGGLRLPTSVTVATTVPATAWGVQPGATVMVGEGGVRLPQAVVTVVRTWRPARMPTAGDGLSPAAVQALVDLPPGPLRDQSCALVRHLVDLGDPSVRVSRLVGAGPGLTPSGDDALGGVLLALRLLGPELDELRAALWESVRARLPLTTSLSASLLAEAADGYAVPAVVVLGQALVDGSTDRVQAAAGDVAAVGHTSGMDLLAGIVGCLEILGSAGHLQPDLVRSAR
jgi:hypothetical protein